MSAPVFGSSESGKPAQGDGVEKAPMASNGHMLGLVGIILTFATIGRVFIGNQTTEMLEAFGRVPIYLVALGSMWFLVVYALAGLRRETVSVRYLIDAAPLDSRRWGLYVLLALTMFFVWGLFGAITRPWLRLDPDQVRNLLVFFPNGTVEKWLWVSMSLSAGFCEELIYRGYLLRQFGLLTNSLSLGIALQALCYGLAHAALPWRLVILVTCLGILFGIVAAWKRTLVPGMLMHAALDLLVLARR
jgi:membrane protease YdiL (CAAX protease family)